jgi:HSP20 family molecular chaperone IbpA
MAFFPRNFYTSNDTSFTPLFRLLDDFDTYSRQNATEGSSTRRSPLTPFAPKFDIRETADTYELHGELPGMKKENVSIEFTDAQNMLIRGKVERTYTAGTAPNGTHAVENKRDQKAITGAESPKPHKATVEDAGQEEEGFTAVEKTEASQGSEAQAIQKSAAQPDRAKYWLSERTIGEFSRTFNFPARVDQDGVTANLTDGILNITVPKAKKHEARRIAIQ